MKTFTCEVCGALYEAKRSGTCVKSEVLIADTLWDYMNCPRCGCQILLGRRYRDKDDPYFGYLTEEPETDEDTEQEV